MPNPYHDAEGKFTSRLGMSDAVDGLVQSGRFDEAFRLRQEYTAAVKGQDDGSDDGVVLEWEEDDFEDDEDYDDEFPPTAADVEEARLLMEFLGSRRRTPMYRGDWERVNHGSGPTLGQVRQEAASRNTQMSAYEEARTYYEKLLALWEASDKNQDRGS